MIQQVFISPQGRSIKIEATDDYFLFYHMDAVERQEMWYNEQIENGEDLPIYQKLVDEFYGIAKKEWSIISLNWESQMINKTWFTDDMLAFIKSNL